MSGEAESGVPTGGVTADAAKPNLNAGVMNCGAPARKTFFEPNPASGRLSSSPSGPTGRDHEPRQASLRDVAEALRLDDLVVREAPHQRGEGDAALEAGERRSQAVVDTLAERQVPPD